MSCCEDFRFLASVTRQSAAFNFASHLLVLQELSRRALTLGKRFSLPTNTVRHKKNVVKDFFEKKNISIVFTDGGEFRR